MINSNIYLDWLYLPKDFLILPSILFLPSALFLYKTFYSYIKTRNCMLSEGANKLKFLYINSPVLRQKQEKNRQEKRGDWLTVGKDGEIG